MPTDRSYMFARTRNRGFRKGQRSTAPSVLSIEKEPTCEVDLSSNVEPQGSASVVSPAISQAISPASSREQSTIETQGNQSCNQSGGHSEPLKPNCFTCAHRRDLAGDAHSSCSALGDRGLLAAGLFLRGQTELKAGAIHVRGATHGVRSGWFMWPINYDPVWLEICSLHKPKPF
jgi:hypothetical protein